MIVNRTRIITPDTDPQKFTEHEAELFRAGKCGWQTYYGMPWEAWCEKPSEPGASFGFCAEHAAEMLENYWPDGSPRESA